MGILNKEEGIRELTSQEDHPTFQEPRKDLEDVQIARNNPDKQDCGY